MYYNAKTEKYVMYMHLDDGGGEFFQAAAGHVPEKSALLVPAAAGRPSAAIYLYCIHNALT